MNTIKNLNFAQVDLLLNEVQVDLVSINTIKRGLGRMPPINFEILHALKCVLGASEVPFHEYIYTSQLPSSFSRFRSKSTTYRTLASSCTRVM